MIETSYFIPALRIGKPGWYNKFREQNCLLNQSSLKILLIGDSVIPNLGRYPEIWKKNFRAVTSCNQVKFTDHFNNALFNLMKFICLEILILIYILKVIMS